MISSVESRGRQQRCHWKDIACIRLVRVTLFVLFSNACLCIIINISIIVFMFSTVDFSVDVTLSKYRMFALTPKRRTTPFYKRIKVIELLKIK